ncbi:DUF4097 family beta strand repeat-containing protein [Kitasatospora sp. NPDC058063]|uniref:DUF4097 family beta strand repeat-containing protein n=1 Tax=unclassified Kitasatospora TaxID=2633591 RepID=UPI0036D86369
MSSGKNNKSLITGTALLVLLVVIGAGAWTMLKVLPGRKDFSQTDQADAASVTLLTVNTANAGVSLSPSNDSAVHVTATGKYTDSPPTVTTSTSGGTITVSQSCSGDCDIKLDITLPAQLAAKVSSGDSWTTGHDLAGSLDITTRSGAIDLTNPSGPLTLKSGSGQIKVAGAGSDTMDATSKDGEVRAAFRAAPTTANVTTHDGGVDITLPSSDYYIQAQSANSSPKIDLPIDRNSKHSVTVKTNSGGIDIHR